MLILYDLNKNKITGLTQYKELKRERALDGEEVLSFLYPQDDPNCELIKEEVYIRTQDNEYVIKEMKVQDDWIEFVAKINVESIKGTPFPSFEVVSASCSNAINLALAGTDWTIGSCDITKKRSVKKAYCSAWDILQEIKKVFICELRFDAINKKVFIYETMGSDKGVYFSDELNLKDVQIESSSYDFCTRIIPIGKDGLKISSINGGKEYVENHQYSNKNITIYWEANDYSDAENLKEDTETKLNELSKPVRAYSAEIYDLARLSDEYKSILDYDLGDTITLISKNKNIREMQRIVKISEYLDEPERNSCEIANRTLTFEDMQAETLDAVDTVNSITTSDGKIDSSKVDLDPIRLEVNTIIAEKANIGELNAAVARIGTLETTSATITELEATNADIANLTSAKADVTDLTAATGRIAIIESKSASIENLLAGNIGVENLEAGLITAESGLIANGAIKDAMIENLSVSKILADDISTNKFRIVSDSGNMLLSDNTIQIKDDNLVRVQIGKDASNDYNMYVWDASGNLMFDATGLKESGIKEKIIRDDMVSDTANINGSKIEKESLVTQINGAATTLNASKIKLDTEDQTLDVAFTSLKSTVTNQGSTVTSQGTSIDVIQGQISTKVWQQDITTAVDNMQVGGRNLLTIEKMSVGATKTTDVFGGDNAYYRSISSSQWRIQNFTSHDTGIYSLGFWAKATTAEVLTVDICDQYSTTFNITTEWQYFKLENKNITSEYLNQTYYGLIDFSGTALGTLYLSNVKLEKGSKCTDWSLAPEDTQGQIDNINTNITTNYSTTTQTTTLINTAVSSVTTELHSNYSTTSAMNTAISQSASGVLSAVSSTYATKNDLTGKVDLSAYNSYVSQTAREISLKVSTTDYNGDTIASLINQSATTIKLSASKIDLSGYVTITSLITEGATTINGANITTGTITAEQLAVGVLNNKNLTIGKTITGTSLSGAGSLLYDGNKKVGSTWLGFGTGTQSNNGAETSYIQIDLGELKRVAESRIYFYSGDTRYYWHKLKYSIDGVNWYYAVGTSSTTGWVTSVPSSSGTPNYNPTIKSFTTPIMARYFRLYANGNTINNGNHIYEWELFSDYVTMIDGGQITTGSISADKISGGTITGVNIDVGTNLKVGNSIYLRNGTEDSLASGTVWFGGGSTTHSHIYSVAADDGMHPESGITHYYGAPGYYSHIFEGGDIMVLNDLLVNGDMQLNTLTTSGATNVNNSLTVTGTLLAPRVRGTSSPEVVYLGSSNCKVDMSGGDARWQRDGSNYIAQTTGGITIYCGNVARHSFNSNGTKSGGSIEIGTTNYGLSPIDSPKVLIEDIMFDIDVQEEGTTIQLDDRLVAALYNYAVFSSNGKIEVVEKNKTSFTVRGYTGKVDFRIVGKRIDSTEVDWLTLY